MGPDSAPRHTSGHHHAHEPVILPFSSSHFGPETNAVRETEVLRANILPFRNLSLVTSEPHIKLSAREAENYNPGALYSWQGIKYASLDEAAYALILEERFNINITPNINFQVPIGRSRENDPQRADFYIEEMNMLVEVHYPRTGKNGDSGRRPHKGELGDFETRAQKTAGMRVLGGHFLPNHEREPFRQILHRALQGWYEDSRNEIKSKNPDFVASSLVVTSSPEQFFEKIVKPLTLQKTLADPDFTERREHETPGQFVLDFNRKREMVSRENRSVTKPPGSHKRRK